tara:strand:+ start:1160 stop:1426 length:267 start_codon:yes stop_codon:yes gene_type:complete
MSENYKELKTLEVKPTKGKFKTFTNGSFIEQLKEDQPYLGKELVLNVDRIMSVYPSEDGIGTQIHSENNLHTWKVLEEIDVVVDRLNE